MVMKTMAKYSYQLQKIGSVCKKIITAFVSGFPRNEELDRMGIRFEGPVRKQFASERKIKASCYQALAKPVMQKMTLSKEKKKEKSPTNS